MTLKAEEVSREMRVLAEDAMAEMRQPIDRIVELERKTDELMEFKAHVESLMGIKTSRGARNPVSSISQHC